jgi:protein-tyrosine phosphatase
MAALIFQAHIRQAGLTEQIRISSAGIESWHAGEPADPRTVAVLKANGYRAEHVAAVIGPGHLSADLLVAMDRSHESSLRTMTRDVRRVRLLMSFIPGATGDLSVSDPYFGDESGFTDTLHTIEAAMPGLVKWARERTATQHAETAKR